MQASKDGRRLAAIMFTDMVGYSALSQRNERLALQLVDEHRRMVRATLPQFGGREVDTTGDGFLIEFSSALQAVRCAISLQQQQARNNEAAVEERRFQFRVGIHLGEVEPRGKNIIGDGVNIAARIEPLSPHGGVAISGAMHALVLNRLAIGFTSLGTPELKNINQPVEVLVVEAEAVRAVLLTDTGSAPASSGRSGITKPATLLALAVVVALTMWALPRFKSAAPVEAGDKSVAVLPFANLSGEADSVYFTDGLQDSILTKLAQVKDLKVISRTSVMRYREGVRDLRSIATELGVAHIVEGSVQRSGDKLRVNVQLIRAANDAHLWAADYDRSLSDVFQVQADIAEQITRGVRAQLTPEEKARVDQRPTQNLAAYELYLRAFETTRQPHSDKDTLLRAIADTQQAVALDPRFARGFALLSQLHDYMNWGGHDSSPARVAMQDEAAEQALRLDPKLAEGYSARAMVLYHGAQDYAAALRELDRALDIAPSDPWIIAERSWIHMRQGNFELGLQEAQRAIDRDPRNENLIYAYASFLRSLRRYAEADRLLRRLASFSTAPDAIAADVAWNEFLWTGNLEPWEKSLGNALAGADDNCATTLSMFYLQWMRHRFHQAAQIIL
ncbi:MAG TPA: adenylate/guanylate cyclase domain-containing protein, partial [Solimonas sp.]|nr:adenylate/guanylate cyclase domain-containing protein [Solimonas sp.]